MSASYFARAASMAVLSELVTASADGSSAIASAASAVSSFSLAASPMRLSNTKSDRRKIAESLLGAVPADITPDQARDMKAGEI